MKKVQEVYMAEGARKVISVVDDEVDIRDFYFRIILVEGGCNLVPQCGTGRDDNRYKY